jgi:hypothetical protein
MSPAFLSAVEQEFKPISVTVDWFHVAQLFTKAVDDVRKFEAIQTKQHQTVEEPKSLVLAWVSSFIQKKES